MKKILVVFGTRPEAIKMCPLINELHKRKNIVVEVCVTGQHREMLDQVLHVFKVKPDYDLNIMKDNQDLFDIAINILSNIKKILIKNQYDLVLVHGDTSTTFITAIACFYLKIPIGHVEAGLRTYNIYNPYPEEFNRESTSILANYNFAPTVVAKNNLIKEGKDPKKIFVTGNTVIDALKTTINDSFTNNELEWAKNSKLIFITAHRRESLGLPMHNMFKAIKRVLNEHDDVKALFPIHLNPYIRDIAKEEFSDCDNIHICEPVDVIECHNIMHKSYIILTDSGGIQEEAPALGKPVLVMRNTTERPEGIEAGTLMLVGTSENSIYENFTKLLNDTKLYNKMSNAVNPYGDGYASERIADVIEFGHTKEFM